MGRYVLLYRYSEPHQDDLDRITRAPGVTVLDHTLKRAMLVEASEDAVIDLRAQLKNWIIAEEAAYPRPGPARETLRRKDEG